MTSQRGVSRLCPATPSFDVWQNIAKPQLASRCDCRARAECQSDAPQEATWGHFCLCQSPRIPPRRSRNLIEAVVFLASDASSLMSAAAVVLDGSRAQTDPVCALSSLPPAVSYLLSALQALVRPIPSLLAISEGLTPASRSRMISAVCGRAVGVAAFTFGLRSSLPLALQLDSGSYDGGQELVQSSTIQLKSGCPNNRRRRLLPSLCCHTGIDLHLVHPDS